VYLGKTTEIWMSKDAPIDKEAVTAALTAVGLGLEDMSKTDKSAL